MYYYILYLRISDFVCSCGWAVHLEGRGGVYIGDSGPPWCVVATRRHRLGNPAWCQSRRQWGFLLHCKPGNFHGKFHVWQLWQLWKLLKLWKLWAGFASSLDVFGITEKYGGVVLVGNEICKYSEKILLSVRWKVVLRSQSFQLQFPAHGIQF